MVEKRIKDMSIDELSEINFDKYIVLNELLKQERNKFYLTNWYATPNHYLPPHTLAVYSILDEFIPFAHIKAQVESEKNRRIIIISDGNGEFPKKTKQGFLKKKYLESLIKQLKESPLNLYYTMEEKEIDLAKDIPYIGKKWDYFVNQAKIANDPYIYTNIFKRLVDLRK